MRIRHATVADIPAITDLFNALILETTVTWRDGHASIHEMAAWFSERRDADHPVLVAANHDKVVGYACWSDFRGGALFPGYRHTVENTIHVDREHQGLGVGRSLLTTLIDIARQREIHVMVAGLDADNTASISFHQALGFEEVARMPEVGRKFDRWLDLVLMQRTLT